MATVRTPSTSDFSTLDAKARNDNTTLHNTTTATTLADNANAVPEVPNRANENEFEVPKQNEVHPGQNHGDMDEDTANKQNEETEKNKQVNPGMPNDANAKQTESNQSNEDVNTLGNQENTDDKINLELR